MSIVYKVSKSKIEKSEGKDRFQTPYRDIIGSSKHFIRASRAISTSCTNELRIVGVVSREARERGRVGVRMCVCGSLRCATHHHYYHQLLRLRHHCHHTASRRPLPGAPTSPHLLSLALLSTLCRERGPLPRSHRRVGPTPHALCHTHAAPGRPPSSLARSLAHPLP